MDWTIYWFMLPVCIAIAGVAMFCGISGAAMLRYFRLQLVDSATAWRLIALTLPRGMLGALGAPARVRRRHGRAGPAPRP